MTKQGGLRARVVVYKFSPRLSQIREEIFHRDQINPVAPTSRTRDSVFWRQASDWRRRVLSLSEMWREEVHETKPMTRRAEMRTLSRRFLNRRTVAARIEVMAVGFEADAAIGQSEIADDQVSACLRRETLAVRLCIMRGEKQALLHQRSTSASGGARRTKSDRVLIMIGYPPTSAFAICEFVATSMSIRGWVSGTNPIIDGVPAKASHQQRNLRCGAARRLVSETAHTVSLPDL
jgi:hypothetical protein